MQIEHEEDGPSEQESTRHKSGGPQAQAPFAARLQNLDPMEARSVAQGDKNQNESADAKRRKRLEFIRNLSQECRDVGSGFPCCFTRPYKLLVYVSIHTADNCRY
jgi:hypothetical protein